jgi:hypothetical protein
MPLLSLLARIFFLRRLLGAGRHRRRSRSGFGMTGPFPTYRTRTRRGTQVSVGGCCLPIPLALGVLTVLLGRLAARR